MFYIAIALYTLLVWICYHPDFEAEAECFRRNTSFWKKFTNVMYMVLLYFKPAWMFLSTCWRVIKKLYKGVEAKG